MPKFDIDVARVGVGFATITVEADSQAEAEEKALDEAGNHSYSEKSSEYELVHGSHADQDGKAGAKSGLEKLSVHDLMLEVRRRGHVACVWSPQDLIDAERATTEAQALEALAKARSQLEDRMTEIGWDVIDTVLPRAAPGIEDPVSLIVWIDASRELEAVAILDADGREEIIDLEGIDEDVLYSGRCIVEEAELTYPRANRHGVPEFATDEGSRKLLRDAGFFVPDTLEVAATDTRDDTPARFEVTLKAPREVLIDAEGDRPRAPGG